MKVPVDLRAGKANPYTTHLAGRDDLPEIKRQKRDSELYLNKLITGGRGVVNGKLTAEGGKSSPGRSSG